MKVGFGKYKDLELEEAIEKDTEYFIWMVSDKGWTYRLFNHEQVFEAADAWLLAKGMILPRVSKWRRKRTAEQRELLKHNRNISCQPMV